MVFSCMAGQSNRIVSLYASPALAHDRESLTYRFGLPERVESQFPREHPQQNASQFRYAQYFRPQTDRTEVSFRNGEFKHTIFSDLKEGKTPPVRRDVRVSSRGRDTEVLCADSPLVDFSRLEEFVPCDAEGALASCK